MSQTLQLNTERAEREKEMHKVIDLFAGCGGLSLGFKQAGFSITSAVEFDAQAAQTYSANFPEVTLHADDIKDIDRHNTLSNEHPDVIIGGPPCQGFSMAGARIRHGFTDDPRNYLFKHYLEIVNKLQPKVFVMENVRGLLSMRGGLVFREIFNAFADLKLAGGESYKLDWKIVNAMDFGIPQARERLIIVGATIADFSLEYLWNKARLSLCETEPDFFTRVNVRQAISNLPEPTTDGRVTLVQPNSKYSKYLQGASTTTSNHRASRHSATAIRRMKQVAPGENYLALDERISSIHSGSYGRLVWDEPASTITTRFDTPAGGRFTHPIFDRTLTAREAARIQSFPDSFSFSGNNRSISRQIGNAVPPKLARFLAEVTKHALTDKLQQ